MIILGVEGGNCISIWIRKRCCSLFFFFFFRWLFVLWPVRDTCKTNVVHDFQIDTLSNETKRWRSPIESSIHHLSLLFMFFSFFFCFSKCISCRWRLTSSTNKVSTFFCSCFGFHSHREDYRIEWKCGFIGETRAWTERFKMNGSVYRQQDKKLVDTFSCAAFVLCILCVRRLFDGNFRWCDVDRMMTKRGVDNIICTCTTRSTDNNFWH